MVLDNLDQWQRYAALSPRLAPAFAFLESFAPGIGLGRHEIQGNDVYAMVQTYRTAPVADGQFEAHRTYLDVQYVHTGREVILWAPLVSLTTVTMAYDLEKDAALYALGPAATEVRLGPGQFAILLPADGHMPGRCWGDPAEVLKVVVKVRV